MAYAKKHGHSYQFFSSHRECMIDGIPLASPWCKVKAMLAADSLIGRRDVSLSGSHNRSNLRDQARAVLFIDSDAILSVNYSMSDIMAFIRIERDWDMLKKPMILNQDGPGWSCKFALKFGYSHCLNSGTLFWIRGTISTRILQAWWNSAAAPYGSNNFPNRWKTKWPWEQAPLHEIHRRFNDSILLLSFPNNSFLPWTSTKNPKAQYPTDSVEPWCFSHWPGANCFITHHAASVNQKLKLMAYRDDAYPGIIDVAYID